MQSKGVRRYRPGQAPKWAQEGPDEDESSAKVVPPPAAAKPADEQQDRRLRRAAQRHTRHTDEEQATSNGDYDDEALRLMARRRHQEAEVVFTASKARTSEDDSTRPRRPVAEVVVASSVGARSEKATKDHEMEEEQDEEARRQRIKERFKQEEEELEKEEEEEEEEEDELSDDEEDSSEYESEYTDSEEDEATRRPALAPTFVRKQERDTIRERELKHQEEAIQAQRDEEMKERRKAHTRELLVEAIQEERTDEQQNEGNEGSSESEADPDEEEDEEAMFEKWKIRELKRIRRDQEEKLKWEKEQQEIEKRRGLTDAEIAKLDAESLKPKEKKKWKFLQKYYHKGAFYQDDDLVQELDYAQPTLEDRFDKTILPKVMQVKNFGRAGRTKWTHLVDQDTTYLGGGKTNPFARPESSSNQPQASTDRWDPWAYAPALRAKYLHKMGGAGNVDDPLNRKRKKPDM